MVFFTGILRYLTREFIVLGNSAPSNPFVNFICVHPSENATYDLEVVWRLPPLLYQFFICFNAHSSIPNTADVRPFTLRFISIALYKLGAFSSALVPFSLFWLPFTILHWGNAPGPSARPPLMMMRINLAGQMMRTILLHSKLMIEDQIDIWLFFKPLCYIYSVFKYIFIEKSHILFQNGEHCSVNKYSAI